MSLHGSAARTLSSWTAPNPEQEKLRTDFLRHLDDNPDGTWRTCAPSHVTASSVVIDPVRRQLALVLHGKVNQWLPSGGHCEPGDESLADTALREATEETGIVELQLLDPLCPTSLDRHRAPCQPGLADYHLDVHYFSIAPENATLIVSDESHDVQWFPFDQLPDGVGGDVPGLAALAAATFG